MSVHPARLEISSPEKAVTLVKTRLKRLLNGEEEMLKTMGLH